MRVQSARKVGEICIDAEHPRIRYVLTEPQKQDTLNKCGTNTIGSCVRIYRFPDQLVSVILGRDICTGNGEEGRHGSHCDTVTQRSRVMLGRRKAEGDREIMGELQSRTFVYLAYRYKYHTTRLRVSTL